MAMDGPARVLYDADGNAVTVLQDGAGRLNTLDEPVRDLLLEIRGILHRMELMLAIATEAGIEEDDSDANS